MVEAIAVVGVYSESSTALKTTGKTGETDNE